MGTLAGAAAAARVSFTGVTPQIQRRKSVGERRSVCCSFGSELVSSRRRAGSVGVPWQQQQQQQRMRRRPWGFATCWAEAEKSDARVEEVTQELEKQAEDSKAAYGEAVDGLKQETLNVQESAKAAYEPRVEKAIEVLRETSEKLRVEAEKARVILTQTAFETAQSGRSNLDLLAENAPDPIKDIAETAVTAHLKDNSRQGSKIHDFCLGIPYGALLVAGGLLWFTITGSTAAIRFGVILGGIILALSITSLRVWKEGKSSIPYIKGQAAVASIIFAKDARKFFQTGASFPTVISALASAGILAFYAYVYMSGGNPPKRVKAADATT